MMSLSDDKQAEFIGALNTTSRYLDDILNKTCSIAVQEYMAS